MIYQQSLMPNVKIILFGLSYSISVHYNPLLNWNRKHTQADGHDSAKLFYR